jgi:hypothetical protein
MIIDQDKTDFALCRWQQLSLVVLFTMNKSADDRPVVKLRERGKAEGGITEGDRGV